MSGMNVLYETASPREILGVLRRNECLAFLVDLPTHHTGEGVPVQFFGAETRVPSGAATLALRTGASVIVACVVREGAGYMVHARPLAPRERTRDVPSAIQEVTQEIMAALEDFIRQYPDQWFMFRPMWPD